MLTRFFVFLSLFTVVSVNTLIADEWIKTKFSQDSLTLPLGTRAKTFLSFEQIDTSFKGSLYLNIIHMQFYNGREWKDVTEQTRDAIITWKYAPGVAFERNPCNYPYDPCKLLIRTQGADTGFYRYTIAITNGKRQVKDSFCFRSVTAEHWKTIELWRKYNLVFPSSIAISYDTAIQNFDPETKERILNEGGRIKKIIYTEANDYNEVSSEVINSVFIDKQKNLWVTRVSGITKFNGNYSTTYNQTNSDWGKNWGVCIDNRFSCMVPKFVETFDSTLFVATWYGLFSIKNEQVSDLFETVPVFTKKSCARDIAIDPLNGNLYVVQAKSKHSFRDSLFLFNGNVWEYQNVSCSSLGTDSIIKMWNLKFDKYNNLWAIINNKVCIRKGALWEIVPGLDSIPMSHMKKFEVETKGFEFDNYGVLWLVTGSGQLVEYEDGRTYRVFNRDNCPLDLGGTYNHIPFFKIDSSNIFYFASQRLKGGALELFFPYGIPAANVTTGIEDENNSNINTYETTTYPSPADNFMTFAFFEGLDDIQHITISNYLGQSTEQFSYQVQDGTIRCNTESLCNGVYHLSIKTSKYTKNLKFVVKH